MFTPLVPLNASPSTLLTHQASQAEPIQGRLAIIYYIRTFLNIHHALLPRAMNAADKARQLAEQISYYQNEQNNLLVQVQTVLQNAAQASVQLLHSLGGS